MEVLQDKILREGIVVSDTVLKVDSFLNHQIDPELMDALGKEIATRFQNEQPTKILTIEASGIAVALMVGFHLNLPVLFAKKKKPSTIMEDFYTAKVHSFTKNTTSDIVVSKKYLNSSDRVIIVDDFLATGEAALGLYEIAKQAGATVLGVAAAIEKGFQKGRELLEKNHIRVESLVCLDSLADGKIAFR